MVPLTQQQQKALEKFKESVSGLLESSGLLVPEKYYDQYLLKWLAVRNYDPKKTESKFLECLAWRKEHGVNNIFETWKPPEVLKPYATPMIGHDKDGCSVWIYPVGQLDIKGFLMSLVIEDGTLQVVHDMEKSMYDAKMQSEKLGTYISHHTSIIDFEGLDYTIAFWRPAWKLAMEVCHLMESYYPDSFNKIFIINGPKFFPVVYSLVKPLLSESISSKFQVFDSDRSKWVPAILEAIDPSQLPKHWGGTMVDPDGDPRCPSKIWTGGKIPKSMYFKCKSDPRDVHLRKEVVQNGEKFEVELTLHETDSKIKWMFKTDGRDIGFVIHYKSLTGPNDVIHPYSIVECDHEIVEGEISGLKSGRYMATFDNSYYKLRKKVLYYYLEIF